MSVKDLGKAVNQLKQWKRSLIMASFFFVV